MTPIKKNSHIPSLKRGLTAAAFTLLLSSSLYFTGCNSSTEKNYELEKTELTKGLITTVKEVKENEFKITDETVVDQKADSRLIAEYLDGQRDTFTLEEARLIEQDKSSPRRSGMSGVIMTGVMGYYLGRSMSSPINSRSYSSPAAYQKASTQSANTVRNTARRTTVTRPTNSSKGYGSGRSSRSSGG